MRDAPTLARLPLDEVLAGQERNSDACTRWALSRLEQSGFNRGCFGVAETLSGAEGCVSRLDACMLESGGGETCLFLPRELPEVWNKKKDNRFTAWAATRRLARVPDWGEPAAAGLTASPGPAAGAEREMAYRLYRTCKQKNRSPKPQECSAPVQSLPETSGLAGYYVGTGAHARGNGIA